MSLAAKISIDPNYTKEKRKPPLVSRPLTVTCVSTLYGFDMLRNQWNQLVLSMREPHPFVLWEWQHSWWEVYPKQRDELFILTVFEQNKLIGLAPFYIKTGLTGKQLTFIGEGEARNEAVVTHYPDLLCRPEDETRVISAVADYLTHHRTDWDYASFTFVLENALLQQLGEQLTHTRKYAKSLGSRFILPLPDSFEDFLSTLGKSTRKQFRLKHNRLNKSGELSQDKLDGSGSIRQTLAETQRLHQARQQAKSETNAFESDRFNRFHRKLLHKLHHTNYPDFPALLHDDQPIALAYNFNIKRRVYSYLSGFKSRDDKRLSPMFIFDLLEIRSLIERGFTHYDFLSANETGSYKEKYRCETEPVMRICWFKQSSAALLKQGLLLMCNQLSKVKQYAYQKLNS